MIHSRPEIIQRRPETIHTHQTAPTQFVEANGIRFGYRRFGKSGAKACSRQDRVSGSYRHRH